MENDLITVLNLSFYPAHTGFSIAIISINSDKLKYVLLIKVTTTDLILKFQLVA